MPRAQNFVRPATRYTSTPTSTTIAGSAVLTNTTPGRQAVCRVTAHARSTTPASREPAPTVICRCYPRTISATATAWSTIIAFQALTLPCPRRTNTRSNSTPRWPSCRVAWSRSTSSASARWRRGLSHSRRRRRLPAKGEPWRPRFRSARSRRLAADARLVTRVRPGPC
jgi:hypothetical protein